MTGISYPNLPTDSVYKFLCITGLIVLVISFVLSIITLKENFMEKFKLNLSMHSLELKAKYLENDIAQIDSALRNKELLKSSVVHFYKKENGTVSTDSSDFKKYLSEVNNRNILSDSLGRTCDSIFMKKTELRSLYSFEDSVLAYCNNGIKYGTIGCIIGFIFWFVNNQVYQDLIIKIQSGYKILPKKEKYIKGGNDSRSDEDRIQQAWNSEIRNKVLIFLGTTLILIICIDYSFKLFFPFGVFKSLILDVVIKYK